VKLEIEIGGHARRVEFTRTGTRVQGVIDGRSIDADAVDLRDGNYSILIAGRSLDVHVEKTGGNLRVACGGRDFAASVRDPRKFRRGSGALAAEGRQHVTAPMPGKIVRVLLKAGAPVEAGQGLLVVEAMKMQNEIRSPKSGIVEKFLVTEGQPVNAGDTLAIVA
jgi:biotin carboxyl carrier protein